MFDRALVVPVLLVLAAPATGQDFKLIVHPGEPVVALTVAQVSRLFLRKDTRWPDGTLAKPVVLGDQRLRAAFFRRVHGKTPGAIYAYWNQMIFSGHEVPPPEKRTVSEVIEYVRSNPGAIGFVPDDTVLSGVRPLTLKE